MARELDPTTLGLNELQMAMVALAMFLETKTPGDGAEKFSRLKKMMESPATQTRFATGGIKRFIDHSKDQWRDETGTTPKKRVVLDKGHPGVGAQGRAHRKKVTATKVRHKKKERRHGTSDKV